MSYKVKSNSGKRPHLTLVIVGAITLLLIACGYYFLAIRGGGPADKGTGTEGSETINLNPPTEEELNETEEFKKRLANNSDGTTNQNGSSDSLKSVTPVMGYLQQTENLSIESNGYISGIAETDGNCTLTLEKDGVRVSESRQAMLDAQGMICGHMVISRDRLSQGSWKGYISYKSSKYSGISEQRTVEVN